MPGLIAFLTANLWRTVSIGLMLAIGVQSWRLDREQASHDRTRATLREQVDEYRVAYQTAVANAHAAARFVEVQQERITHEVSADYQARLADVRARYSRLLAEANADSRDAGEADLSGVPDTARRTDEGPAYCGLSLDARLVASEQALQLHALQDWLRGQVGIARE